MKIKICCIKSDEEAKLAIQMGADILGLVGPMPSGPGPITTAQAGAIVSALPHYINSFYLTSKTSYESIVDEYDTVRSSHIQLTDHVGHDVRNKLRNRYPQLGLVQVVHIIDESSISQAKEYAKSCDILLMDSGSPKKAIKELGGTGRTHNWKISRAIVESVDIPVFLAGGISVENLERAWNQVLPYGIDLCSGVRTNDRLDSEKLTSFFKIVTKLKNT